MLTDVRFPPSSAAAASWRFEPQPCQKRGHRHRCPEWRVWRQRSVKESCENETRDWEDEGKWASMIWDENVFAKEAETNAFETFSQEG